jgi:hypothetical protein
MKKAMALVKKHRPRVFVGILAIILALFVTVQLSLGNAGVCVNQGRVLSEAELRQAVLQSLMNIEIENQNIYKRVHHAGKARIGVVRNPSEPDVLKLMERTVHSDKTFEENFGIEEIALGIQEFDVGQLREPFMLANYTSESAGGAAFYVSTEIQQINNPEQIKKLRNNSKLNLYERIQGFGKYYFHIPRTFIDRGCCDSRIPEKKRGELYYSTLKVLNWSSKNPKLITHVSNCGELLTFNEEDSGLNLQSITWIQGE